MEIHDYNKVIYDTHIQVWSVYLLLSTAHLYMFWIKRVATDEMLRGEDSLIVFIGYREVWYIN